MAKLFDKPVKRLGTPKPSSMSAASERSAEAYERAKRRWDIARLAVNSDGSLREKRKLVKTAMDAGFISPGAVPAHETIRRYEMAWEEGARTVEDFWDDSRDGAPDKHLHSLIQEQVRQAVESGSGESVRALWMEAMETAEALGEPEPSYYLIKKEVCKANHVIRVAARHGSRAAEIEGLPHARIPSRFTHDTWALDELTMPVYHGQYCDTEERWVSARADVVLIIDVRSTVPVAYYIADPSHRRDEEGRMMRAGYDSDDVLAALLSASSPELAPDATREFAGYLPDRLRWDNAAQHKELEGWIKNRTTLEIDTRRTQKRRPISNGTAENRVNPLKAWMKGVVGHVDEYIPTDREVDADRDDQPRHRTIMAGRSEGHASRKKPIDPEDLPTLDELRLEFDRNVNRYARKHVNRVLGATAATQYHQNLPRRPRNGRDLVRALSPRTTHIQSGGGIIHYAFGRSFDFYPIIDGALLLLDTQITYYADPLARGVFVERGGRLHFARPSLSLHGDEQAKKIARNQKFIARYASDQADMRRDADMVVHVGRAVVGSTQSRHEEALDEARRQRAQGKREPASAEPLNTESGTASQPPVDPWSGATPDSFIKEK